MQAERLSVRRRRVFWAAMLLLPVLFFGGLEAGLRLAGYGGDEPLFMPVEADPQYLYQNTEVGRRYFARTAQVPNSLFDVFRAQKDTATYRIFVQGGSSAAGFPFYFGGSFSRMLEQRLLQTFPARNIEVVNTAMAAVNSYTLLDFVDEIIAQRPDAVLIYAGHNEYYGALGVGSSESLGPVRPLIKLYLRLQHLRTVQALRSLLGTAAGWLSGVRRGERPEGTLMERMVGEQAIPYGAPLFELGLRQFRGNLAEILARYRAHGISVLIGTVASNERDHRPFVSALAPGTDAAAWQARYEQGRAAARAGDTTAALAAFDAAIRMDSLAADAYYEQARLLDAAGRYDAARRAYHAAKDRDNLRFRAPEAVNAIIREEAARHGAVVVEVQAALAQASPGGIIGRNLMVEHLHPNVEGYFRIADAFYEALRVEGMIGAWTTPVPAEAARRELLLTPVDSLVATYRIRSLEAGWPFQPPGVVREVELRPRSPLDTIAVRLFRGETTWIDAMEAQQQHFEAAGDFFHALQTTLSVLQQYPFLPSPYLAAGNLYVRQGAYREALPYFEAANDLEESVAAHRMIGSILLEGGDRPGAIRHLERALALDPEDVPALYNLSGAYTLTQQYDRARATLRRLLQVAPGHPGGRRLLAGLPPA